MASCQGASLHAVHAGAGGAGGACVACGASDAFRCLTPEATWWGSRPDAASDAVHALHAVPAVPAMHAEASSIEGPGGCT